MSFDTLPTDILRLIMTHGDNNMILIIYGICTRLRDLSKLFIKDKLRDINFNIDKYNMTQLIRLLIFPCCHVMYYDVVLKDIHFSDVTMSNTNNIFRKQIIKSGDEIRQTQCQNITGRARQGRYYYEIYCKYNFQNNIIDEFKIVGCKIQVYTCLTSDFIKLSFDKENILHMKFLSVIDNIYAACADNLYHNRVTLIKSINSRCNNYKILALNDTYPEFNLKHPIHQMHTNPYINANYHNNAKEKIFFDTRLINKFTFIPLLNIKLIHNKNESTFQIRIELCDIKIININ